MGFPRQEYWSGVPLPSPGDLPDPGIEPSSLALAGGFFATVPLGKPWYNLPGRKQCRGEVGRGQPVTEGLLVIQIFLVCSYPSFFQIPSLQRSFLPLPPVLLVPYPSATTLISVPFLSFVIKLNLEDFLHLFIFLSWASGKEQMNPAIATLSQEPEVVSSQGQVYLAWILLL